MRTRTLLGAASLLALAAPTFANNGPTIAPAVAFSVHDEPVDNLGDSFNLTPSEGLIRTQSSRADRAMHEYDVSAFTGQSISAATLSGRVSVNNAFDNGVRTFDFSIYDGNGAADLSDYQVAATVVGSGQYQPPMDSSFDYSFDVTSEVQALLLTGATHVGLRVEGTSNPSFPNVLSTSLGTLTIKLGPPASTTPFCFGDGTGNVCPCGNTGAVGMGCANSAGSGALLASIGTPNVSGGSTFMLAASGAVPSTPGLFFEGLTSLGNGQLFGDGLRCAGGQVTRLQVAVSSGMGASLSSIDIPATSGAASGETRYYQLWYRDTAPGPCGTGFNLTNGLAVTWQP